MHPSDDPVVNALFASAEKEKAQRKFNQELDRQIVNEVERQLRPIIARLGALEANRDSMKGDG